ncbi:MAG: DUF4430 domain-containing protein [Candidatus Woesearchaeota archaeon]
MNKKLILILIVLNLLISSGCSKRITSKSGEATLIIVTIGNTTRESFTTSEQNALQVLASLHRVKTQSYSNLGIFIKCIDEVCSDSKYFWAFYINGRLASESASAYTPKAGDTIEFRYQKLG